MSDEIEIEIEQDAAPEVDAAPAEAPKPAPAAGDPDSALAELKAQLERERQEKATALAERQAAEQRAREATQEAQTHRGSAQQAQHDAISRAIEATATQIDSAENEYAAALESGDFKAAAKAQTKIAQLAARRTQLEDGKTALEAQRNAPQPVQPSQEDALSRFSPRTANWLRAHPECVNDQKKQHLVASAHYKAVAQDLIPDSDAYFDFIEREMGYKQAPAAAEPSPMSDAATTQRAAPAASAPPSRSAPSPSGERAQSTRFRMTPKMVELAELAGLTPAEWAKAYLDGVKRGEIEPIH